MTPDIKKDEKKQAPAGKSQAPSSDVCGCLILDPCGCYVDPCSCVAVDEISCYDTSCGCINFR